MESTQPRAGSPVKHEHGQTSRVAPLLVGKRPTISRLDMPRRSTGGGSFAWHQAEPSRRDPNAPVGQTHVMDFFDEAGPAFI
jgi:hypothetical protein